MSKISLPLNLSLITNFTVIKIISNCMPFIDLSLKQRRRGAQSIALKNLHSRITAGAIVFFSAFILKY